ncbi:MAG: ABC transporter ATP-binding protein [Spirochaetes bacterium]|uniref:ABC transporter ATP-binding protein n=1 Tax=Candidatus Ornithospirochaeta stercoripullorum TaxID=2840899 RepID=A0A9D9E2X1_9SPIO|nr:ABC transporter ATP-binding protein [Candidatus Ornithospirochaeta stercoripullorum]
MEESVLTVRNLRAEYPSAIAVDGLSFSVKRGECLALVGESGSGKSTIALSLLRLGKAKLSGEVLFSGRNLLDLTEKEMTEIRGREISAVFQDSMSGLNPVITVGHQLVYVIRLNDRKSSKQSVKRRAVEYLSSVGLEDATRIYSLYPHELSGGMRQRVMIAMALAAGSSSLLIADEPTTALDVTVQKGILSLLRKMIDEKAMAMLLISHDLGVVSALADRILVLYGGKLMEERDAQSFFSSPRHPYSKALLRSARGDYDGDKLFVISGNPFQLGDVCTGCRFASRCHEAIEKCFQSEPPVSTSERCSLRCWKYGVCDG